MRRTREKETNLIEQEMGEQTTAAKCDLYVGKTPVTAVIDSGAATSIVTKPLLESLGYPITGPSNMIIVTANGSRVRALGVVEKLPINLKYLIIRTDVHVLESKDKVLILGNDWLQRVNATMDWRNRDLTIKTQGRTVKVPISFTMNKTVINTEVSDDEEEEYEEEEIEESYVYYSDHFSDDSSEISFSSDDDLEFNPWTNEYSPIYHQESEENFEEVNPAVYLAQQEPGVQEKAPILHLGPLIEQQQSNFQHLLEEYKDICAESQTKIGRTHLIKHKIITGDAEPTA